MGKKVRAEEKREESKEKETGQDRTGKIGCLGCASVRISKIGRAHV